MHRPRSEAEEVVVLVLKILGRNCMILSKSTGFLGFVFKFAKQIDGSVDYLRTLPA